MFDLGTVEFNEAEDLISNRYMADLTPTSDLNRADLEDFIRSNKDYANTRKDEAVVEYGAWNTRWHLAQQNYRDLSMMESVFGKINILERLDITYKVRKPAT